MLRSSLVAIGGLLGSLARYWLSGYVQQFSGSGFPFGTLVVNILGSFILGVVGALSLERGLLSQDARLFLGVGFCGGFTTMSTFSYETVALLRDGTFLSAFWNVSATIVSCFTGVWLGSALGRVV
ncbi:MAG TPA: fluoride efflux transporter CrcB [Candidatus Acidoferrales bacterium]|nr:fluoride efflux transporter CrcB [Candidatus Acidoferrales bacterium]